jgi:hypothetical protein
MAISSEIPTTSSALEELKDGDYDIVQLSKKVDEAVIALHGNKDGTQSAGTKDKRKKESSGTKAGESREIQRGYTDADVDQVTTRHEQMTEARRDRSMRGKRSYSTSIPLLFSSPLYHLSPTLAAMVPTLVSSTRTGHDSIPFSRRSNTTSSPSSLLIS